MTEIKLQTQLYLFVLAFAVFMMVIYMFKIIQKGPRGKKIYKIVITYVTGMIIFEIFLIPTLILLYKDRFLVFIFRVTSYGISVWNIRTIRKFSIVFSKLEDRKDGWFVHIIMLVLIFLPANKWETIHITETNYGFSLQPITLTIMFFYALITIHKSVRTSVKYLNKIMEPILREIYRWITRCFKLAYLQTPALLAIIIYYMTPMEYIKIASSVAYGLFILQVFALILSLICVYIGLTLPKFLLRSLYKKYEPMWLEEDRMNEKVEKNIRRLREAIF